MDSGLIYMECNKDCPWHLYVLLCMFPIPFKCVLSMHIYTYTQRCTCIYTHTQIHTYIDTHTRYMDTHTNTYTWQIHMYAPACTYVHTSSCIHTYTCTHTYVHTHTHTHTYTHTLIHMHTLRLAVLINVNTGFCVFTGIHTFIMVEYDSIYLL